MTLLFCDSFDDRTVMHAKRWQAGSGTIGAYGRNGTAGMQAGGGGNWLPVPSAPATIVVGTALQLKNANPVMVLWLRDGATTQVSLQVDSFGRLIVYRNGVELARTAVGLVMVGAYNYLELKATIDPAVGVVVVRLNGNVVMNLAGQNTRATANSWVDNVLVGADGGNCVMWLDDLYVCDSLGAVNNNFLGDVRVQAILPNGAGAYTQWDGLVGAATHWQAQASNPPDDDASYVSDSLAIPGHLDSYALGNVTPTSGTVPAVQVSAYTRKDDAGIRTLATMVRSGAVDAVGANVNLGNAYIDLTQVYELDPGGAAWTIATVNALEAGVKAVA